VSSKELAATNIDLVFDGLDTFASVEFVRYTTVFPNAKTGAKHGPLGAEWT
jgi:beta-mannosidase